MLPDFDPLFRNPHLATIAGNFWPRAIDTARFPSQPIQYRIDKCTTVLAQEHQPPYPLAQIVCLHGLEGSANAGYIQSLAQSALESNIGVHRLNLRTCGDTEDLCQTMYHSGLTEDTWIVLQRLRQRFTQPIFLVGFSLGGNVALKLAGEFDCASVLSGVCAVSAPIDLAECVRAIDKRQNILYARRFLSRLKGRIRRKSAQSPGVYDPSYLKTIQSIWEFDDRYTAPLFGFGSAANYYATQSSQNFLRRISIPGLLITAQDDPLVPYSIYKQNAALASNSLLQLIAPRFGGHLGFLSRNAPRFWIDIVILEWIVGQITRSAFRGTAGIGLASL